MINKIEKCNVFGVHIACVNMDTLLSYLLENIKNLKNQYICVTNVHAIITANDDKDYMNIQNNSLLSIPDGGPVATYCKNKGFVATNRTAGPDVMETIIEKSIDSNLSHFFYGSTEETLEKMKNELFGRYNNRINIVGMYSPPFRELTKEEDDKIVKLINDSNPDFVWVGLGAPKQERWMANHKNSVNSLMLGVGAAFDYLAKNIKRAPMWMQKLNLEWVYRLIQDPKRLFKRYLYTNTRFLLLCLFHDKCKKKEEI